MTFKAMNKLKSRKDEFFTGVFKVIIIRYLVRETLKSQLAILFISFDLLLSKLVRILGAAVDGYSGESGASPLGLGVPEMKRSLSCH